VKLRQANLFFLVCQIKIYSTEFTAIRLIEIVWAGKILGYVL